MKKILLLGIATAGVLTLWGQGTLRLIPGAYIKTTNGAYLVLDNMHLVNDGSLQQAPGDGFVKFTGGMNVNLSGGGTTVIDALLLTKSGPANLDLQTNISVASKVLFSGGLLNLKNSVLDLGNTGVFSSESETSRAFTTGIGYVQASGNLSAPSSVNLGNLGAVISSPVNLGNTIVRRGHAVQEVFGKDKSIKRFYDLIPANNKFLKAVLRLYYFDAELIGASEASLNQWKSLDNTNWTLVGADARDLSANYVEKQDIGEFSRWTLAGGEAPTISCPSNITVSSSAKSCKASVSFAATATGNPTPTITYRIGKTVITSPYTFPKGITTVTATASNGVTPNATCTFTVMVVCGPTTPVTEAVTDIREEIITPLVVTARPNPSSSYFTLNLSSGEQEPVSLRVVDLLGREVEQWSNVAPNGVMHLGQRYRPGIYLVRAAQGSRVVVLRLVKAAD